MRSNEDNKTSEWVMGRLDYINTEKMFNEHGTYVRLRPPEDI